MTGTSRRASCVSLVVSVLMVLKLAGALSIKETTYYDENCTQPTGATTHSFGGFGVDEDGLPILGECDDGR